MEQAGHTPGPWRVAPGETPGTEGDAQTAIDHGEPFGDTLCLFPVVGGEPGDDWLIALMPYEGTAGAERIAELEANARLIAPAPAILEALIEALDEEDAYFGLREDDARAAIAQARGGEKAQSVSAPHCSGCRTDSTGIVLCCPIHAAADTAIGLLRRLVAGWDAAHRRAKRQGDIAYFDVLAEIAVEARPILARIDGATAPAESEA